MRVLVLNAGSSSLKASIIDGRETRLRMTVSWGHDASRASGRDTVVQDVLDSAHRAGIAATSIDAVGHRVVHGGSVFVAPVLVDEVTLGSLAGLGDLAPLHNDVAIETIRVGREVLPGVPHVACFDTAFHATLPESIARYPVPESWSTRWGIRRFGFHGLSVEWAVRRAAELLGRRPSELNLVVAHLGSGCSVTAVRQGRSVATSMGFTPLEGLMMGTRAGSLDPGLLLHLLRTGRMPLDALEDTLQHGSGLLGVSGRSADVRELEAAAGFGDEPARLALEMFVERAAAGVGAAVISLPLLEALVFTGGIGENAGRVRAAIVERLAVVGIGPVAVEETGEDRVLAVDAEGVAPPSRTHVIRVEAREDLVIAAAASTLVGVQASAGRRKKKRSTLHSLSERTLLRSAEHERRAPMAVARVTEISSTSTKGFEDAIQQGIDRATKTLRNVKSAWVKEQRVDVDGDRISNYQVNLMVTFVLDD